MDRTPIITIRGPIWDGGKRKIGIAPDKVTSLSQAYKIQITYKNKAGERIYPNNYWMRGREIKAYPIKTYRTNFGMKSFHIIPVEELPTQLAGLDICPEHNAIMLDNGLCPMEVV